MCGRYSFVKSIPDARIAAIVKIMDERYPGSYKTGEIFPGDTVPGIIAKNGRLAPVPAVFGFSGFEEPKLLINARLETAEQKKTFAEGMRDRRIVLPASGFYEWSHDTRKAKYFFSLDHVPVLYLCGIYRLEEGIVRFVILTREANDSMKDVHSRMPLIIKPEEVRAYLTDAEEARRILQKASPFLKKEIAG